MLSLHRDAFSQPHTTVDLDALVHRLQNPDPEVIARVAKVRELLARDEAKAAKGVKAKLPAVTISGTFTSKGEDGFVAHSGFYVYDYDALDNVDEVMSAVTSEGLECVALAFVSPSGRGLKVVLQGPVATDADDHRRLWKAGLRLLRRVLPYEVAQTDEAAEVSRLCYLSDCRAAGSMWAASWYEPFNPADAGVVSGDEANEHGVTLDDVEAGNGVRPGGATMAEVREWLWAVGSDIDYQRWMRMCMAVVQTLGKGEDVKALLEQWSQECGGERGKWSSADRRTFETLWKNSQQKQSGAGVGVAYIRSAAVKAGWRDWYADLRRETLKDGRVKIVACEYNIGLVLDHHPQLRGRLWRDEITDTVYLDARAGCELAGGGVVELWIAWHIVEWLQTGWGVKIASPQQMLEAMMSKGRLNTRNKRREWLQSLTWDGVERCSRLFVDGFGAKDTALNRAVGLTWMIGAAARVLKPGVDFQLVPILQSDQGKGKSTGIAALCPEPEWFVDSVVDMRSKEGYALVRAGTIIELAELSSLGRADMEAVKAFISHRHVTYRSPYDRQVVSHPASWVFIGTTNEHEVLKDGTGNRRFVPMEVTGRNGHWQETVAWVTDNREQLWAEAVHFAKSVGRSVVLPENMWGDARAAAEAATIRDVLDDSVAIFTAGCQVGDIYTGAEIFGQLAGMDVNNRGDHLRAGAALRRAGWSRHLHRVGKAVLRAWKLTKER